MSKKMIVVEPLAIGSRLQLLSYFCEALVEDERELFLVVAQGVEDSPHWEEMMRGLEGNLTISSVPGIKKRVVYRKLKMREACCLFRKIKELSKENKRVDILFAATDDYFINLPWLCLLTRCVSKGKIHIVRYRAEGTVFSDRITAGYIIRKTILKLSSFISNVNLIVFDERVKNNCKVLPDPWKKQHLSTECIEANQDTVTIQGKKIPKGYFLLIGKQDKRKGIEFIIRWLNDTEKLPGNILFIGKIDNHYSEEFDAAINRHAQNIIHIDSFVSENDMLNAFKHSQAVLMPYHPEFMSSSGVLAHAVAFSKPVVASDHGLVGYRVKKHKLGVTFRYGEIQKFIYILENMVFFDSFDIESCREFSNITSTDNFKKIVKEVL